MYELIELYKSILPKKLYEIIQSIPDNIKQKSESELRKNIKPNKTLYSLRSSFWKEFESAQHQGRVMSNTNIFKNICSPAYFYKKIYSTPEWVAWISSPNQNYENQINSLVMKATDRIDELLSMDITNPKTGTIDHKKGELLLKTIIEVTNRAKGQAVSRSYSKNASLVGKMNLSKDEMPTTLKESEKRIKQLQKDLDLN